jgi:diacylglycerol kinase family enzyme
LTSVINNGNTREAACRGSRSSTIGKEVRFRRFGGWIGFRSKPNRNARGPGDAARLAVELREAGHDLPIVAGGASALSVTLAPLRAGHGSDLARALPPGEEPRPIDAVQATFHDAGGRRCERWFVNMASFGLGAEVVRRGAGSGRSAYLLGAAVALARCRPMELSERCMSRPATESARVAECGSARARLDDGWFDVSLIGEVGLLYSGRIYDHPQVGHFRAADLRAEGEAGLELDGETAGFLPAGFRLVPGALSVLGLG